MEECEAFVMALWAMIDSSRIQQGERFIVSQLLAASFQHPNLGRNLSVHPKVLLLLNIRKASCSQTLYLYTHTEYLEGMKLLIECGCVKADLASVFHHALAVRFSLLLLCFFL